MPKKHTKRWYRHLNQADRDRLQALRDVGTKQKEIAVVLGVDPSTISREVARNRRKYRKRKNISKNKNARYEAGVAQHKAYVRRKYAKYQGKKISEDEFLRAYIAAGLKRYRSPDEISGRMRREHQPFYASKTAIYEWLYTAMGSRWYRYLYTQRYRPRKRKGKKTKRVLIPNRIGLEARPLGATNRTRYGHYEADTAVSARKTASKAALSVIYERKARYIEARKAPNLRPVSVIAALKDMQEYLAVKSMTFDNGIENTKHEELGLSTYFCDPYSSWQKGGVEQAIGMIRRFIPKKSDIGEYSDEYIQRVIEILNHKPRKSLQYKTAYEVMVEHNLFLKNKNPEVALRG